MRRLLSLAVALVIAAWSRSASAQVPTPPPASATPAAPSSPSLAPALPTAVPAPMPPVSATPPASDGTCAAAPLDTTGQLVGGLQAIGDFAKQRADEFPAKAEGTFQGVLAGLVGEELMNWLDPRDRVMSNGQTYGDWLKHGHPEAYDKMYEWAKGGGDALTVALFFQGALESLEKYGPEGVAKVARVFKPEEPGANVVASLAKQVKDPRVLATVERMQAWFEPGLEPMSALGEGVNEALVKANLLALVPTGNAMLEITSNPTTPPLRKLDKMVKVIGVGLAGLDMAPIVPDIGAGLAVIADRVDEMIPEGGAATR